MTPLTEVGTSALLDSQSNTDVGGRPEIMATHQKRRRRSSIRRGEAAGAILDAASELFAKKGYAATSILDIAAAAGVARPTVFTAVGAKPVIFRAVLEVAVAGEAPGVPVAELPWLREVLLESDQERMLRMYAHNIRLIGERISDLYWAAECGAGSDEDVREVFRVVEGDRLAVGRYVAAALAALAPLRGPYDATSAADVLNTVVSPASWRALVRGAGWTPDRFEEWTGESVCRLLLIDH